MINFDKLKFQAAANFATKNRYPPADTSKEAKVRLWVRFKCFHNSMVVNNKSITRLLIDIQEGGDVAYNKLFTVVYNQLRSIARHQLAGEQSGHTLSKTALVHEAYIKLIDQTNIEWQDRAHFFAIAAKAMRQILVDYARKKTAQKRGGNRQRITLDEDTLDVDQHAEDLIVLNDLIERMARFDERKSRVVEMRFFAGMTIREIAELLEVSTRTVDRDWLKARTWLHKELQRA